jgi:hypothetical protein
MKIDGSCHCGNIAYEAEADPEHVAICHCSDCQSLSGTAFRVLVYVPEEKFRLLKGTAKTYVKIAESGRRRIQAFCPDCGSSLYSTGEDGPRDVALRVGALRQRALLQPKRQYWCRSALPWVPKMEEMPRQDRQ